MKLGFNRSPLNRPESRNLLLNVCLIKIAIVLDGLSRILLSRGVKVLNARVDLYANKYRDNVRIHPSRLSEYFRK